MKKGTNGWIRATKKKRKVDRISSVGYHRSDIAMDGMGCLAVANGYMFFVLLLSGFSFVRSFVRSGSSCMHMHVSFVFKSTNSREPLGVD